MPSQRPSPSRPPPPRAAASTSHPRRKPRTQSSPSPSSSPPPAPSPSPSPPPSLAPSPPTSSSNAPPVASPPPSPPTPASAAAAAPPPPSPRRRRAPSLYGRARVAATVARCDRVDPRDPRRRRNVVARLGCGDVLWAYEGGSRGVAPGGSYARLEAWAGVGRGRWRLVEIARRVAGAAGDVAEPEAAEVAAVRRRARLKSKRGRSGKGDGCGKDAAAFAVGREEGVVLLKADDGRWIVEVGGGCSGSGRRNADPERLVLDFGAERKHAEEWRDAVLLRLLSWDQLAEESTGWLVADLFPDSLDSFCGARCASRVAPATDVPASASGIAVNPLSGSSVEGDGNVSERSSVVSDITASSSDGMISLMTSCDSMSKSVCESDVDANTTLCEQQVASSVSSLDSGNDPFPELLRACASFNGESSSWLVAVLAALRISRRDAKLIFRHVPILAAAVQLLCGILSAVHAASGGGNGRIDGAFSDVTCAASTVCGGDGETECDLASEAGTIVDCGTYDVSTLGGVGGKLEGLARAREDVQHVVALAVLEAFAASARGERGSQLLGVLKSVLMEIESVGGEVARVCREHVLGGGVDGVFPTEALRKLTVLRYKLTVMREDAAASRRASAAADACEDIVSDGSEGAVGEKRVEKVGVLRRVRFEKGSVRGAEVSAS